LQDLCSKDSTRCPQIDQYVEYCFENLSDIVSQSSVSEQDFEAQWATTIGDMLNIPSEDILALYQPDDTHNSNTRVREFWKYGTSVGMSGTPQAFVNGVMLEEYPTSAEEWMAIFNDLYPSTD
jgi:hypothetical protein